MSWRDDQKRYEQRQQLDGIRYNKLGLVGDARLKALQGLPRRMLIEQLEGLESQIRTMKEYRERDMQKLRDENTRAWKEKSDQYDTLTKEIRETNNRNLQQRATLRQERANIETKLRDRITELEKALVVLAVENSKKTPQV